MKLIAVSDSHRAQGQLMNLAQEIEARGDIDLCVHLGDVTDDADFLRARLTVPVWSVPGNCDRPAPDEPAERLVRPGGAPVLICHGHTLGVKMSMERLLWRAEACGAVMAMFGHTHAPLCRCVEGLWLLNPGALMDGRYAVVQVQQGRILPPRLLAL